VEVNFATSIAKGCNREEVVDKSRKMVSMRASGGSFCNSRSIAFVVRMLVAPGCITLFPRLVWVFGEAGALDVRNVSVAAV
jgi:hypothetical protein